MSTYTPIASTTLSSATSSVTFNSIPQNYTDLIIVTNAVAASGSLDVTSVTFNNDTSTLYSSTRIVGQPSAVDNDKQISSTSIAAGLIGSSQRNIDIYQIQNYSNNTTFKTCLLRGNVPNEQTRMTCGVYRSTNAITAVTIAHGSGLNFNTGSTFNLYGIVEGGGYALGGDTVTTDGTYWYHTFLSSGAFIPTQNLTNVDYLVVAGGGGGGRENFQSGSGGGGGAGGLRCTVGATGGGGSLESKLSLVANQPYQVIVGAGGAGYTGGAGTGSNGSDSVFSSIISVGGGGGGGGTSARTSGMAGGSGGGAASNTGTTTYGEGTANQGYRGGSGGGGLNNAPAGGGGGAGAVGGNSTNTDGGAGGAGVTTSINGSSVTYAGGGGGCSNSNSGAGGAGGSGGGGTGATYLSADATAGTANTGGGAGGSGNGSFTASRAGGSGIVIVRYAV